MGEGKGPGTSIYEARDGSVESGNNTSCLYLRVMASQSSSVSSLILTCNGKLWPIVAAAGASQLL